jgi:hypothetical protein
LVLYKDEEGEREGGGEGGFGTYKVACPVLAR